MSTKSRPERIARNNVIKRGARYAFYLELPPDPATGKRRKRWFSGYPTARAAQRARDEQRARLAQGSYVPPTRQTVAAFLKEWLITIAPTVRASTLHSYDRNLRLHVIPRVGALMLTQVDGGALNAMYAELLANGRVDRQGPLSPRTVRYIHTIVHRAFKDAVRWKRLALNPTDAADPPRESAGGKPEIATWSADRLAEFLDLSRNSNDRYQAVWHLLATTGLRRGEALGLRWADVDLRTGVAGIRQTVIAVNHQIVFGIPKTARGCRSMSLDADTVAVLREHRSRQNEERLLMGGGWRDYDLVFTKVDGSPLHPERVSREFDRRVKRWGLPHISLHDLRHTWATLALAAAVHPKVVQERLGHSTIGTTLNIYSHVTPGLHADAAETVAALIRR